MLLNYNQNFVILTSSSIKRLVYFASIFWCNFKQTIPMSAHPFRGVFMLFLAPILMGFCVQSQGVKGLVLLEKEANMPLKGGSKRSGTPISTMVFVYESASINQLTDQQGHFTKGLNAKLIKQVRSGVDGTFKLKLKPGKYTILLGYKEGLYIPFFSGMNGVAHIEVIKHQFQEIDLSIAASSIF
jgi:hypothetical protein